VTASVDSSSAKYAVIETRRTESASQRFVIVYHDEERLRELIAGPSIIACGFLSREEAQTNIDTDFCSAAALKKAPKDRAEKYKRGVPSPKGHLGVGFNLTQTGKIVRGFVQSAMAGAILIFYSRNAVSTVIRSFVGG
jgi:hypothetical protein